MRGTSPWLEYRYLLTQVWKCTFILAWHRYYEENYLLLIEYYPSSPSAAESRLMQRDWRPEKASWTEKYWKWLSRNVKSWIENQMGLLQGEPRLGKQSPGKEWPSAANLFQPTFAVNSTTESELPLQYLKQGTGRRSDFLIELLHPT